jgi:hypothetical protein
LQLRCNFVLRVLHRVWIALFHLHCVYIFASHCCSSRFCFSHRKKIISFGSLAQLFYGSKFEQPRRLHQRFKGMNSLNK